MTLHQQDALMSATRNFIPGTLFIWEEAQSFLLEHREFYQLAVKGLADVD